MFELIGFIMVCGLACFVAVIVFAIGYALVIGLGTASDRKGFFALALVLCLLLWCIVHYCPWQIEVKAAL